MCLRSVPSYVNPSCSAARLDFLFMEWHFHIQLMDLIFARMKARSDDGNTSPEFRVPLLAFGIFIVSLGLFWLGWSAKTEVSWAMIDVGAAIFTCGAFVVSQAVLAYLLDEFHQSAASANAAARMMSNVLGFVFPLFAPKLCESLGYGWGCSLFAFVWMALTCTIGKAFD